MNITAHIFMISANNSMQKPLIPWGIYELKFIDGQYSWRLLYLTIEVAPKGFIATLKINKNYEDYNGLGDRFSFSEGDLNVNTGGNL